MSFACSTAHSAIGYASQHHREEVLLPFPYSEVTDEPPNRRGEVPRATETGKGLKLPKANKLGRFEVLIRRYHAGVYSIASRLTNDPVEAVLLTHGAFISRRRQSLSRRDEVEIVTVLLTAVIRAHSDTRTSESYTGVHANESITEWNRVNRQRCSLRCAICSAAERARAVESERCAIIDNHSRAGITITVFTMIETRESTPTRASAGLKVLSVMLFARYRLC